MTNLNDVKLVAGGIKGGREMSGMIDKQENPERIWVCEECNAIFTDMEIRKCMHDKKWGHTCKAKKYKEEHRCESYCKKYLPE